MLLGPDYETLLGWAETIRAAAFRNPGLGFVRVNYDPKTPQVRLHVNLERAADLGISAQEIGRTLETMFASRPVTTYIDRGEEYDIYLQAKDADREDFQDLTNIFVRSGSSGKLIQLSNLVSVEEYMDSPSRSRMSRQRSITLSAALVGGYTQGEALDFLHNVVAEDLASEPVQVDYIGGSRQYLEASSAFLFTFGMALLIVYLVLAAQFESLIHPFVIMLTVPVAITGGLFALYMMGISLNIYAQIGLIILVGLAAKNGILIVEFANQLRDEGVEFMQAVLTASHTRFRPIIMTGLSTSFGSLPLVLASGPGANARISIGIVIFSGVILATLLTVFIVPVFYVLLGRHTKSPGHIARLLMEAERSSPATVSSEPA